MKTINTLLTFILLFGLMENSVDAKKDSEKDLPPGMQQKLNRGGELPPGWQHKQYQKGEILDRQTCDESFIVEPENRQGIIGIRVGDKVLRVIRSTREIVEVMDGR